MSAIEEAQVILITGANKGIGFHLVKKFIENSSKTDVLILLGCRSLENGKHALALLNFPRNVHLIELDVTSKESVLQSIAEIKQKYGGQLDVLVNNAGICTREITMDVARNVMNTNYYGTQMLNEHFIPLMKENGRIINVSSGVGTMILQESSKEIQEKFTSSTLTKTQLDQLVDDFLWSVQNKTIEQLGYNVKSEFLVYGVSKAALNSLTQIEAREFSSIKNLIFISVTPGLCATDMTIGMANTRSPELGADSILYVIKTPRSQLVNGGFYRDGKQVPLIKESLG